MAADMINMPDPVGLVFRFLALGLCLLIASCASPLDRLEELEKQVQQIPGGYKSRPYRTFVGGTIKDSRIACYVENWRRHIERVAEANYPKAAIEQKIYGNLIATVAIRADGTLESVRVDRSSGFMVLDSAAIDIVNRAAPFEPFTEEMRRDTDVLHITRTWTFTSESLMRSGR